MAEQNEEFSRGEYFNYQDNNGNGLPDRFEAGYDPQTGLPLDDTFGPETYGPQHFSDGPYSKIEQRHPMAELVATYPTPRGMDQEEREAMGNAFNDQKEVESEAGIKTDTPREEKKPFEMGEHERRGVAGIYNNRREIPKAISLRKSLANSPKSHDKHETGAALFKDAYEGLIAGFTAGFAKKKERLAELARATVEQAQIDDMRRQDAEAAISAGLNQRDGEAEGRTRENVSQEDEKTAETETPKPTAETENTGPSPVEQERDRYASATEAEAAEAKTEKPSATIQTDAPVNEAPANDGTDKQASSGVTTANDNREKTASEKGASASETEQVKTPANDTVSKSEPAKPDKQAADPKSPITRAEANANSAIGMAANTVVPGAGPVITAAGMKKAQDRAGTAYEITPKSNAPGHATSERGRFNVGSPMGTGVTYTRPERRLGPSSVESASESKATSALRMRDNASKPAGMARPASKGPSGVPAFGSSIMGRPGGFGMKLAKAIYTTAEKSKPAIDHLHGIKRDKSSMER